MLISCQRSAQKERRNQGIYANTGTWDAEPVVDAPAPLKRSSRYYASAGEVK